MKKDSKTSKKAAKKVQDKKLSKRYKGGMCSTHYGYSFNGEDLA